MSRSHSPASVMLDSRSLHGQHHHYNNQHPSTAYPGHYSVNGATTMTANGYTKQQQQQQSHTQQQSSPPQLRAFDFDAPLSAATSTTRLTAAGDNNAKMQQLQKETSHQPQMYFKEGNISSSPHTNTASNGYSGNSANSSRSGTPINGQSQGGATARGRSASPAGTPGAHSSAHSHSHAHSRSHSPSDSLSTASSPVPRSFASSAVGPPSYAPNTVINAPSHGGHPYAHHPQSHSHSHVGHQQQHHHPSSPHAHSQHSQASFYSPSGHHPQPHQQQSAAMLQAAMQQQQHHFQSQMAAMLAAGYTQQQVAQQQQQQQQFALTPPAHSPAAQDPRRRAPSLPNNVIPSQMNGGGGTSPMSHNVNPGYFPYPIPQQQQQNYHPQFNQQQQHNNRHPQFSPPYVHSPQASGHVTPPQAPSLRSSPANSLPGSPGRERAPTAPSSFTSASSSPAMSYASAASGSPGTAGNAHRGFAPQSSGPASPGGVADLARRRAESQPNENSSSNNRVPLMPTTAPQPHFTAQSSRERTGSSSSFPDAKKSHTTLSAPHSPHSLQRNRTDSGVSASSSGNGAALSQQQHPQQQQQNNGYPRPASPASTMSDRAPTPTQALHSQLSGSSSSVRSGRTTPTGPPQSAPQQQQQQHGLAPSIRLNSSPHDISPHHQQQYTNTSTAAGMSITRKASPLSQQSTYSDGHRSVTPTQASTAGHLGSDSVANGRTSRNGVNAESDEETEEIAATPVEMNTKTAKKHRKTFSNASSTMSSTTSPQTPSSGRSNASGGGSSSGGGGHQASSSIGSGSLFRNKLRKAMSLSELNNSNSTLASGSTSSSKQIGRSSLTSNSSSSDTSHSTAEPRTPPNGASPVLPRGYGSASVSNLHSKLANAENKNGRETPIHELDEPSQQQNGRQTPNSNSLPSNTGRRFGILNSKMNSSTDNISISSTVSSASMMLRKMGNFGKLARKSSVRSLSNLFHRDNNKKGDEDEGHAGSVNGAGGKRIASDAVSEFGVPGAAMMSSKDRKKAGLASPSVAHVTVELERGAAASAGDSGDGSSNGGAYAGKAGMTPAEALVRKHQERERLEREREEKEKKAAAAIAAATAASASARARTASVASSSASSATRDETSPKSKLLEREKERLKSQNAGKKSIVKKFSFGTFHKSTSTSNLRQEALSSPVARSSADNSSNTTNSKGEKERERDNSPRSSSSSHSANASPIFDSSATSSSSVSPVIHQHEIDTRDFSKPLDIDFRPSLDGIRLDTWRNGPAAIVSAVPAGISIHRAEDDLYSLDGDEDDAEEGIDDHTPRQSMELINHHQQHADRSGNSSNVSAEYSDWDGEPPNTTSFFDDDTASFREDNTDKYTQPPPRSGQPAAPPSGRAATTIAPSPAGKKMFIKEAEDYSSDSGADGRSGQAIPKRPPRHARPAKGILKGARSYSQDGLRGPQLPFAGRPRASSYDAPHQMIAPNQPGKVATLAQYIPSEDELDGLAGHPSAAAPRQDNRVSSPINIRNGGSSAAHSHIHNKENLSPNSSSTFGGGSGSPGTSPYGNASHNTSEPILTNLKSIPMTARAVTGPITKRNISFAQNLSVHTTWSGSTYDRRGDVATCNRLTPQLAQMIKEELNAFKMEEMEVHHASRVYTHFFV